MSFFGILGLFFLSFVLGLGTISVARKLNLGGEFRPEPQRVHTHWAPRLGGVPIFLSLVPWLLLAQWEIPPVSFRGLAWVCCLLPAFTVGLLEDLFHRIHASTRLFVTMSGALIAWQLLDAQILRLGLPVLDGWLGVTPLASLALTALFIGGGAHAINIIDGCNGLASSYAMVVLFAIMVAAGRVQDFELMYLAGGSIVVTLGFFVLNFPRGRIFLGDSGAYLLGTLIGFLLAVLVARHPEISPMFAAMLLIYPVWELLFSIYRRRVIRGRPAMQADGLHLHTLVYKRLVRTQRVKSGSRRRVLMNSTTTTYLAGLYGTCAAVAVAFWQDTAILFVAFCAFIAIYVAIYLALTRFKTNALSIRNLWRGSAPQPLPADESR